jgi:hypothetical protein
MGGSRVPEDSELELLAASMAAGLTREYAGDREMFLSLLVETLQPTLGERLRVERGGGWFRRNGPIRRLQLDLGELHFALEVVKGGALAATRRRVVRGIALNTEELSVEAWLQAVAEALAEYARTHREALEALKRRVW